MITNRPVGRLGGQTTANRVVERSVMSQRIVPLDTIPRRFVTPENNTAFHRYGESRQTIVNSDLSSRLHKDSPSPLTSNHSARGWPEMNTYTNTSHPKSRTKMNVFPISAFPTNSHLNTGVMNNTDSLTASLITSTNVLPSARLIGTPAQLPRNTLRSETSQEQPDVSRTVLLIDENTDTLTFVTPPTSNPITPPRSLMDLSSRSDTKLSQGVDTDQDTASELRSLSSMESLQSRVNNNLKKHIQLY